MDLDLTDDQREVVAAIAAIVDDHAGIPREGNVAAARPYVHGDALEQALVQGGFLDLAVTEGCGEADAALLVHEVARSPLALEIAGSALIAPLLLAGEAFARPVAVARLEDLERGVRFLDRARTLIVDADDDVLVLAADDFQAEPVGGPFAYPIGRLRTTPDMAHEMAGARRLGADKAAVLRRLWRIGLAAEIAATMQAAIAFTAQYVKDRQVFGRPVGTYQVVQHRLSQNVVHMRGAYWQAMRAATTHDSRHAAEAALYAQQGIEQVVYDCHQFNGALGMTLEHKLHYYTFRLRWLAGEMGGARAQAAALAELVWDEAA